MKKTIIGLFIILISCSPETNEKAEVKSVDSVAAETHEHDHSTSIELDKGKKWKVDENMMVYFNAMEKAILDLSGKAASATEKEFDQLSEKLNATIDSLTSNCTMEGKGHDELHKWLLPFIDKAEQFSLSSVRDSSFAFFTQMDSMYREFHLYFE